MTTCISAGDAMGINLYPETGAHLSACRTYRYRLWRRWDDGPSAVFVMLNPSTADETTNDRTISRCIDFAKRWGCGGLHVVNLFAYRATDPKVMRAAPDPIGPANDLCIRQTVEMADGPVVAGWGAHGAFLGRGEAVRATLGPRLQALHVNTDGSPKHPLYIRADAPLISYGGTR
ncbi:hypothetical protein ATO13_22296 [Stappia sp. 22II-S9-Z10]|nr:hypothetical protein ATO13_22296 [Stappia sp. 22II-S9-Z10]